MIFEALAELATCLCSELTKDGSPGLCFCGLVPGDAAGDQYAGDCEQNGMAWVRLVTAYPATGVAVPSETPGNCNDGLGFEIEVGAMRCISAGEDDGSPPSAEELLAATDLQIRDMMAMRRAILCCDALNPKDLLLNSYGPIGPAGILVGGVWTLSVML